MSLKQSILRGGIGFCIVSLCVFATVAFAQRWMYDRLSVTGAYIAWLTLFILLGGRALFPLVVRTRQLFKFYALFGAAFFVYGIGWMAAYFTFKNATGEWLGSFAGSVSMALVFAAGFGVLRSAPLLSALLFVANSIGYFLGSVFYYSLGRPAGLLLWGAFYGFSLGAGLGAILYIAQSLPFQPDAQLSRRCYPPIKGGGQRPSIKSAVSISKEPLTGDGRSVNRNGEPLN